MNSCSRLNANSARESTGNLVENGRLMIPIQYGNEMRNVFVANDLEGKTSIDSM